MKYFNVYMHVVIDNLQKREWSINLRRLANVKEVCFNMCLLTQSGGKSSLWSVLSSPWNQTQLQMKKKLQRTKPTCHHQQQTMNTRHRRTCLTTIGFLYCISNRVWPLSVTWLIKRFNAAPIQSCPSSYIDEVADEHDSGWQTDD